MTATLVDVANVPLATLFAEAKTAGPQSFTFRAENLPDGRYRILLRAVGAGGRVATAAVELTVRRAP